MEAIGAAASILGIAEFAFSLATTITTYIGDFQDAAEDISNLAAETTSTFRHIEQLENLVQQNTITNGFSQQGLEEALDCQRKARKLADRLWKLVKKSQAKIPDDWKLTPEQIDLSIFGQAEWPRFKPRVEQHKRELVVLNQNILIAMVDYRLGSGGSQAEQARAVDERERLKKSKKRALKLLREAQEQKRRESSKAQRSRKPKNVSFDIPNPPLKYGSRDFPVPSRPGVQPERPPPGYIVPPPRVGSYDSYSGGGHRPSPAVYSDHYRDIDAFLPNEDFMDRLEEDLRNDIVRELQAEEREQKERAAKTEWEMSEAVRKYRSELLVKLQQVHQENEELKTALVQRFPNAGSENAVARFVDQRQIDMVKDDEVAKLMNELTALRHPDEATVTTETSHHDSNSSTDTKKKSGRIRQTMSMLVTEWRESRRHRRTRDHARKVFSVIVSIDGDLRRVQPIKVPSSWSDNLLAEQGKKGWWKSASFKETMKTYTRLDLTTRDLAESEADHQGLDQRDLVLLYARRLDKNTSSGRKLLESTMLASDPFDFFHGRVLLIYGVESGRRRKVYDDSSAESSSEVRRPRPVRIPTIRRRRSRSCSRSPPPASHPPASDPPASDPPSSDPPASAYGSGDGYRGYHGVVDCADKQARSRSRPEAQQTFLYLRGDQGRSQRRSHSRADQFLDPGSYPAASYSAELSRSRSRPEAGYHDGRRLIWPKVHRDYLSTETLQYYDMPWEIDRVDPNFIQLKRELDKYETDVLFEHTRQMRSGRLRSEPRVHLRDKSRPDQPTVINIYNDQTNDSGETKTRRSHYPHPPPSLLREGLVSEDDRSDYGDYARGSEHLLADSRREESYYGPKRTDGEIIISHPRRRTSSGDYSEPPPSSRRSTYDDYHVANRQERSLVDERRSASRARRPSISGGRSSYQNDRLNREILELEREKAMIRAEQQERAAFGAVATADKQYALHRTRSSPYSRYRPSGRIHPDEYYPSRTGSGEHDRSSSVVRAAEKVSLKRQRARSRLRSGPRPPSPVNGEQRVIEVTEEDTDSMSDLFGSDDSIGDTGGSRHRDSAASAASIRSSVLGLDTTSASPTTLSEDDTWPTSLTKGKYILRTTLAGGGSRYVSPYAETVAESRQSATDIGSLPPQGSDTEQLGVAEEGRALIMHLPTTSTAVETDDEAMYHTAAESHDEDAGSETEDAA